MSSCVPWILPNISHGVQLRFWVVPYFNVIFRLTLSNNRGRVRILNFVPTTFFIINHTTQQVQEGKGRTARFYCVDWWSLILLLCFILVDLACRVGAMASLSPLSNMSPATSHFLGPNIYQVYYTFSSVYFSLIFHKICSLFRVSWTSTDLRRYRAENGTFLNVKKSKPTRLQRIL